MKKIKTLLASLLITGSMQSYSQEVTEKNPNLFDTISSIANCISGPVVVKEESVVTPEKTAEKCSATINYETEEAIVRELEKMAEERANYVIFGNAEIKKSRAELTKSQADALLETINQLLRENKVDDARVLFTNVQDQLQLTFDDKQNLDILFSSIGNFSKNNPLIGNMNKVTDVDIQEYIIRQGLDRLVSKATVADLVYAVNDSALKGDKKQRLLTEVNLKGGNITIALIESTRIKEPNKHDIAVTENIANQLIGMERLISSLLSN